MNAKACDKKTLLSTMVDWRRESEIQRKCGKFLLFPVNPFPVNPAAIFFWEKW
jgi:hypothetical protein